MADALSPLPIQHFVDSNGIALVGGKVFTYQAGTTTKTPTYTDSTGGTPNTNPVILNARGEANIWLVPGTLYKFVLSPSTDTDPPTNAIWTEDNISTPAVGTLGTQNANAVAITGGTIAGVAITGGTIAGATIMGGTISGLSSPLAVSDGGAGGALTETVKAVSTTYSVINGDKGKTLICAAGDYTVTVGAPGGFDSNFHVRIFNSVSSGNAPLISVNGLPTFRLYPKQSVDVQSNGGSAWFITPDSPQKYQNNTNASVQLYVDTGGSDSNSGLSVAGAFLTIAQAVVLAHRILSNGFQTIVNLSLNQTFSVGSGVQLNYTMNDGTQFTVTGQNGTITPNVVVSCDPAGNCFVSREPATTTLQGLTYATTGNGSTAVNASQFATVDIEAGFAMNAFPLGTHIAGADMASINVLSNYQVTGTAVQHINTADKTYVNYGSFGVNIPNALAFTTWVEAETGSDINSGGIGMTFSGAGLAGCTGLKYNADHLGIIQLGGATFPGNAAGTTTNGGQAF